LFVKSYIRSVVF